MVFEFPGAIRSLPSCAAVRCLEHQRTTPFDMLILNPRIRGTLDGYRRVFLMAIHNFL